MCLVCIEYGKGKLKIDEAFKNLGEIKELIGDEHYDEVFSALSEKEAEEYLVDGQINSYFGHDEAFWEDIGYYD
tara:strand:+ start:7377 stop:7598 length:222 start_codon:yes stop_codon:yes gene_type:complete